GLAAFPPVTSRVSQPPSPRTAARSSASSSGSSAGWTRGRVPAGPPATRTTTRGSEARGGPVRFTVPMTDHSTTTHVGSVPWMSQQCPSTAAPSSTGPDAGVPLHHGDPFGEQRAAADGVVVVDRSHRDVLTIGGAERLTWLDGFISQHVADLPNGSGGETLVLDPNGRVEHHAVLSDVDGTL